MPPVWINLTLLPCRSCDPIVDGEAGNTMILLEGNGRLVSPRYAG